MSQRELGTGQLAGGRQTLWLITEDCQTNRAVVFVGLGPILNGVRASKRLPNQNKGNSQYNLCFAMG